MKDVVRLLLGLNVASIIRGFRLGVPEFVKSCFAGLSAVFPFQNKADAQNQRRLESIPGIALEDVLGERKVAIALNLQRYEDGMSPAIDVMALLSILVAENPREVLEIGTYMGHTTRAMAENLPQGIIHTADLPPDFSAQHEVPNGPPKDDFHLIGRREIGREFKGKPEATRIRQHFGDTARMDFEQFGRPTFFFIDGSHTYDYCKQDSEKCLAMCSGPGVFLWHDCDTAHPGVLQFVLEWRSLGRNLLRIQGTSVAYWRKTE